METDKKVGYAVTTNGTVMNPEIARFGQDRGFNYLLSIDGCREAHDRHRRTPAGTGSWDLVMGSNLDVLRSVQPWVGARVTVCPDTVSDLASGVRELYMRGVNQFIIGPNEDVPWHPGQIEEWKRQMRDLADFCAQERGMGGAIRISFFEGLPGVDGSDYAGAWGCRAGRTALAVACDGGLYPCARFVSPFPEMVDRFRLGTVFDGITDRAALGELMHQGERRSYCHACDYRHACAGPCAAVALHMCGDVYTPTPLACAMTHLRCELSRTHSRSETSSDH